MMQRLLVILLVLIASVFLSVYLTLRPGYLLVSFEPWVVQMPLWFAMLALLTFLMLCYFLMNSVDRLTCLLYRFKIWRIKRGEHQSYSKTQQGMQALIEGRWGKAERLLMLGTERSMEPLMNYLGAARAA